MVLGSQGPVQRRPGPNPAVSCLHHLALPANLHYMAYGSDQVVRQSWKWDCRPSSGPASSRGIQPVTSCSPERRLPGRWQHPETILMCIIIEKGNSVRNLDKLFHQSRFNATVSLRNLRVGICYEIAG
jgi:hypothetical protein